MSDEESTQSTASEDTPKTNIVKLGVLAIAAIALVTVGTLVAVQYSKKRSGTIVLPGGVTYLGPSPTAVPAQTDTVAPAALFTADANTEWTTFKGHKYPYSFSYPKTLTIVVFPNDVLDAAAIAFSNIPAQQNILANVDDISKNDKMKQYAGTQSKDKYVENWWKQFGGLKGVSSIKAFVNTKGLHGYRTKFINTAGQTPNEDVFFEVPAHPELVIRLANGILDKPIFDRIIDTVGWTEPTKTPSPK
jgi:hypothetical protein